jgi:GntR family transcriptional regulator / MocR family aminotransferase
MQLVLALDRAQKRPLYKTLAAAIKKAIYEGRLKPGESLPSVRELAEQYSLSRSTVLRCYEDLHTQGYIRSAARLGTFVNPQMDASRSFAFEHESAQGENETKQLKEIEWSDSAQRLALAEENEACLSVDLNFGLPAPDTIAVQQWERSIVRHGKYDAERLNYDLDVFGVSALRKELAEYLSRARGVRCNQSRIVILTGVQQGLDMLCRLLVNPGDAVGVENPGYSQARRTFVMHGARLVSFGVDNDGIIADDVINSPERLKILYLTPSHHDPTGAVLSTERRHKLLKWAAENGTIIVEDDYDCEYRYGREPLQSMQGLDDGDCVVYASTFWRTLGNLTQLGYMVLPQRITSMFHRAKTLIQRDLPTLEQYALSDFIREGHFERHIHKSRQLFQKRRQSLIYNFTLHMGRLVRFARESGGLHIMVTFSEMFTEMDILNAAKIAQLPLNSTANYYIDARAEREYLVPFGLMTEQQIEERIAKFSAVLRPQSTTMQGFPSVTPVVIH